VVSKVRVGLGYDSHRFEKGRRLVIGGLEIPNDLGLSGHSDADILIHALCDAILGAISEGDIGRHFPDTNPSYRNISSMILLEHVVGLAAEKGYAVKQLDATVILEKPKLSGHMPAMVRNVAVALDIPEHCVSIKAKTNEGLGWIGRGEGVAAFVVVVISSKSMNQGEDT
jgi:2-C-methyl-D-erythritol 2,4-cyclodiphosphate synthase